MSNNPAGRLLLDRTPSPTLTDLLHRQSRWWECDSNIKGYQVISKVSGEFPMSRTSNFFSVSSALIRRLNPRNLRVDQSPKCADTT